MFKFSHLFIFAFVITFTSNIVAGNTPEREPVEPLLKSEWGQDAPFFYNTPLIDGQHCRTGCGATALSQVIYYHKYPRQGAEGVYSYQTGRLGTISFDFGKATFDYDLMKDVYERSEPEDDPSVQAVARLMFAAGVTLNMDYNLSESSAFFSSIPTGLKNWFQYPDNGMRLLSRDYFTNEEWEQVIYDELKNNRPVLYLGGNGSWSHIFVCDGYKDGKFHMNWGWYGEKNDYFSLTNLQTERVVADGILSLNSGQKIIIGVRADEAQMPAPVSYATAFDYDMNTASFTLSEITTSYNKVSATLGIKATDAEGSEYFYWSDAPVSLSKSTDNISYTVSFSSLPDGNYTLRPVYRLNETNAFSEDIFPIYCNPRKTRFVKAEIANNRIITALSGTDANINVTISDFTPPSPLIKGETFNANFSVLAENNGNTTISTFKLKFYEPDSDIPVSANEQTTMVYLTPGESKSVVMAIPSNLPPGEYDMYIVDGTGGTQVTYPVLSAPIRINWRSNSGIFTWDEYNLRVMALSDQSEEAILLKNKPNAPSTPQGLQGDLIIPATIDNNSSFETMALAAQKLAITELGPQLVYNETGLTGIVIPHSVKNIGGQAFAGCTGITQVETLATTPPTLQSKVFDASTTSTATLIVPAGCATVYREADGWKEFSNIVEVAGVEELYISDFGIVPDDSAIVPVILTTDSHYYGCQFNLDLPEGLSIAPNGVSVSESLNASDYTLSRAQKSDNLYIILLYSNNHTSFPTGSTDLINITFQATQNFNGGILNISDIEFSMDSGEVDKSVAFNPSVCIVTPEDDSTYVSEIEVIENARVDIYNISGIRINCNVSFDEAKSSLTPGIYIIKCGDQAFKISVQ